MEVAGIALGVLPILLRSVDAYRDSIRRVGTMIRRRKHVETLARALLLQQQILEETVKAVILASGCEDVQALDEDPFAYFNNDDVQEQLEDYLGPKNSMAFVGLLTTNNDIAKKVAKNISGLVPAHLYGPTDDLIAIIEANQTRTRILVDLAPRVKLLLGITDIKTTIQEIDEGTAALERFSRLILSNRQSIRTSSSRKAIRLAKALRHMQSFASNLHRAILRGLQKGCHESHVTRLHLEDRVDMAIDMLQLVGKADCSTPLMAFDLVFAGSGQGERIFTEMAVQVFVENDCDDDSSILPVDASLRDRGTDSQLTFVLPQCPSPLKPVIASVADICATIKEAHGSKRRISLALMGSRGIGTISDNLHPMRQLQECTTDSISLAEVLQAETMTLPWKSRMLLALRFASNLLQLLGTCWLERAWSKDDVFFCIRRADTAVQDETGVVQARVDLSRPFVACSFGKTGQAESSIEPKVALLELGILLLEIWHKTTLEARFGLAHAPSAYYDRMARALEWLDDADEPLPDLYDRAVAHCLRVNIGSETRFVNWEDAKLWNAICGNVIQPLSKICKQWSK
ncbi:hypothetical protein B0T10DRAFT_572978 [Thelonectria olida]|uniref:DUF7580 domain-containing protein n=1 Tax=Thelonectria olida TaxID=1576542 RepID=A0A9P9AHM0_9HYPO|nr:hypothetical protein B0T10DRAFT_572978 [Thelonectria olida]